MDLWFRSAALSPRNSEIPANNSTRDGKELEEEKEEEKPRECESNFSPPHLRCLNTDY